MYTGQSHTIKCSSIKPEASTSELLKVKHDTCEYTDERPELVAIKSTYDEINIK